MNGTFTLSMRTNVRTITSDFKINEEALKKYIDTGNTVKGVTRVFPISMNGTFTLSMRTNVRTITSDFKINGVSSPKQEEISDVKPDISYSELPNGILTGTNFPITVYGSLKEIYRHW